MHYGFSITLKVHQEEKYTSWVLDFVQAWDYVQQSMKLTEVMNKIPHGRTWVKEEQEKGQRLLLIFKSNYEEMVVLFTDNAMTKDVNIR